MELYKDILLSVLSKTEVYVTFPDLKLDINALVCAKTYDALERIQAIIANETLSDIECVEEIVCVFESIGSHGGGRHDFG